MEFIGENDFFVLEKPTGQVKRVTRRRGADRRARPDRQLRAPSAACWASRSTSTSATTGSSTCTGARRPSRRTTTAGDAVPTLGNRLDRFKWDGTTLTYDKTLHRGRGAAGRRRTDTGQPLPRQPQRRRRPRRPGRQDLPAGRRHRPPRADAEPGRRPVRVPARRRGASATTSSAGPDTDQRAPDRRDPAPEPGRHGAAGQPVLPGRRRARRPGRREPEEDLRLRPAQRLRHGVRPVQRRPVGAGERRRLLLGDQPRRAGLQLGLGAGHGPARPRRAVQGDRDDRTPVPPDPARRPATTACSRSAGCRTNIADTPREAYDALFKLPGSRFSDPEMAWKYEVAPGGIDFLSEPRARPRLQGRHVRRLGARRAARRQHLPARRSTTTAREVDVDDRRLRDSVADNIAQVRHHRERVAAVRRELRRHAGRAARARTARSTSCLLGPRRATVYEIRASSAGAGAARAGPVGRACYRFLERATSPTAHVV